VNPALPKKSMIIYKNATNFAECNGSNKNNSFKKGRAG
jgi:hypothetical protein